MLPPVLDPSTRSSPTRRCVHPDLGNYAYVEAAFTPQPGTNVANLTKMRKGDVEQGFAEAEWVVEREYTNPSVQHVPLETHVAIVAVEGRRRGHDLVERPVAVHRPQPVLHGDSAAAQQGAGRHPARRRRLRRQGRHPPRAAAWPACPARPAAGR